MPRPRFRRNPACTYANNPPPEWLARAGHYQTIAHGGVQRFVCKRCGEYMGPQTESMHYCARRRLDLADIHSRLRGGSSLLFLPGEVQRPSVTRERPLRFDHRRRYIALCNDFLAEHTSSRKGAHGRRAR